MEMWHSTPHVARKASFPSACTSTPSGGRSKPCGGIIATTPSSSIVSIGKCVAMASIASGSEAPASSTGLEWVVARAIASAGKLASTMAIFCDQGR